MRLHESIWLILVRPKRKIHKAPRQDTPGLPLFKQSFASNLLWMVAKSKSLVENGGLYMLIPLLKGFQPCQIGGAELDSPRV